MVFMYKLCEKNINGISNISHILYSNLGISVQQAGYQALWCCFLMVWIGLTKDGGDIELYEMR